VANQYFVCANNRIGLEKPWEFGEFYGSSYICNPLGEIVAEGSREEDELVAAEIDLDLIREVLNNWQFFRDRRPETYGKIIEP
jgi:N-carbamoylputrescine amidase